MPALPASDWLSGRVHDVLSLLSGHTGWLGRVLVLRWTHPLARMGVSSPVDTPGGGGLDASRLLVPSRLSNLPERVRLVRRENIPARPASDWSVVRIYLRVL
eukprot:7774483-Pyramimonas_sp.AAC.3